MTTPSFTDWFSNEQIRLAHALGSHLDVDAGLREILLQQHHDASVEDMRRLTDTEAGLAAILKDATASKSVAQTPLSQNLALGEAADRVWSSALEGSLHSLVAAEDRMRLRGFPSVSALLQCTEFAWHFCVDLTQLNQPQPYPWGHELLPRLISLVAFIGRVVPDRELVQVDETMSLLDEVTSMVGAYPNELVQVAFNHAMKQATEHALHLALLIVPLLSRPTGNPPVLLSTQSAQLTVSVRKARNVLAHSFPSHRSYGNGRGDAELLAETLRTAKGLSAVCVSALRAEIEERLDMSLPELSGEALHCLLSDFTTADLGSAHLDGIDLTGVRWSERETRWPPLTDVEELRIQSEETPAGSGLFIVRTGTATVRGLADLA
ncbi:hypothetical protein DWB77_00602 [Streptomyces hundungensis]|uniref:Uncharacterized protein n=1 Tax=Streptomyces hundungensis TaxID=1077946 RepID=A0A387H457_9ACTN|nr:hypothetical protein DWB77_00602 [Streptomyces hundungensis]